MFDESDCSVANEGDAIVLKACRTVWRVSVASDCIADVSIGGLLTLPAIHWSCEQVEKFPLEHVIGCVVDFRECVLGFAADDVLQPDWHDMAKGGRTRDVAKPWALLCTEIQAETLMALAVESAGHRMWRRVFTDPSAARRWAAETPDRIAGL